MCASCENSGRGNFAEVQLFIYVNLLKVNFFFYSSNHLIFIDVVLCLHGLVQCRDIDLQRNGVSPRENLRDRVIFLKSLFSFLWQHRP